MNPIVSKTRSRGFSLVELAIGLVIVAVLLSSLLVPLVTQVDQRRTAETQRLLDEARNALIGFVAANGRFPCPASAASSGLESFTASPPGGGPNVGDCSTFVGAGPYVGLLPAATLGLSPVDREGFQTDAFGNDSNRLRYAVSNTTVNGQTNAFTKTNGMRLATMSAIAVSAAPPGTLLTVCTTGVNCTVAADMLSNGGAIAVIYSLGSNALPTSQCATNNDLNYCPVTAQEQENMDTDRFFASLPVKEPGGTRFDGLGSRFDDMLVWISPSMLFGRLIAAGQQP